MQSWSWVRSEEEARATLGCTPDGMKVIAARLNGLVGKTFDISHTNVFQSATYSPDAASAPATAAAGSDRVRIGW